MSGKNSEREIMCIVIFHNIKKFLNIICFIILVIEVLNLNLKLVKKRLFPRSNTLSKLYKEHISKKLTQY